MDQLAHSDRFDNDIRRAPLAPGEQAMLPMLILSIIRRRKFSIALTAIVPRDLFGSSMMRSVVAKLRERYDLLLDTPPVLAISNARVLAMLADQTLLVVCWRKTHQTLVTGAKLAGGVITQVNVSGMIPADGGQAYAYGSYTKYPRA